MSKSKNNQEDETGREYELEDTFETLKATQTERRNEIDTLMHDILNNSPVAVDITCNSEKFYKKQQKFFEKLLNHILEEEPKDYPIPGSTDLHVQVLSEIQEEVRNAQELLEEMESTLFNIKRDISYLKDKKENLQKIEKHRLRTVNAINNTDYSKEYQVIEDMIRNTKKDLYAVLDILFPKNQAYKTFVIKLLSAYGKGGDDIYVEFDHEVGNFVHFLVDADIASYHRNDRNKVRLMDMVE